MNEESVLATPEVKQKKRNSKLKIALGVFCIVLGLLALVTPLTPGSWLVFVGFELVGIRFVTRKKFSELYKSAKEYFVKNETPHSSFTEREK